MNKLALNLGTGILLTSLLTAALAAGEVGKKMTPKMAPKPATKMAAKMAPKAKTTQMTAIINKVKGDKLTVMPTAAGKKAVATTVMVPASAKIMMGSKMMKLSDLKVGQKVVFMMSNGTVTKVMVTGDAKMASKMMPKMAPKKP